MAKQQTNIRLSDHTKRQLRALAHKLGMSEGQLVMLAIDRLARDEGLRVHNLSADEVEVEEQDELTEEA
jgi:antitoxin component of RelBE/YafQ-DinJ toxin-antitoxin module